MLTITLCLFLAGIAMGAAFACVWAWGVRSGQFRNLEDTKSQVFLKTPPLKTIFVPSRKETHR